MKGEQRPGCILCFDNKTLLSRTWTNKFVMLIWLLISQRNWEKPCVCICSLQSTREEDGARREAAWIQRVKEISLCWKLGAPLAGWYQLAGMCIYCLPSWRRMDSSVCPSIIVFSSQYRTRIICTVKPLVFIISFELSGAVAEAWTIRTTSLQAKIFL